MDNRDQYQENYVEDSYPEYPVYDVRECAPGADKADGEPRFGLSAPARVLLWLLGIIVGLTVLFGCGIFWVWGLDYLGVIDTGRTAAGGQNEFNQPSGSEYNEFEDFYDYFDDYFSGGIPGGIPGGSGEGDSSAPQGATPGIGVTIQEIHELEFPIDDVYTGGLIVVEINPKGALVGKDIEVGDLIVAAEGTPIESIDGLDVYLKQIGVGGDMTLTVARFVNGVAATHEVTITLVDISQLN